MIINRKKNFIKSYKKLPRKIQDKFDEKFLLFIKNPFDISLNNHSLQ
jgi:mRNA-degrading endonuclease RelE of RelBE toxin-antitoxin system